MSDKDPLKSFDFNKVSGGGLFLKFEAGKAVKLRVLTTDPLLNIDSKFGNTGYAWIVYNFTEGKAQIFNSSPGVAKRLGAIHTDEDFGADIRQVDIKISPEGEKLKRVYDINVLPTATDLTQEQIQEAAAIKLEEVVGKNAGFMQRMSEYDQDEFKRKQKEFSPDGDADEPDRSGDDGGSQELAQEDPLAGGEEINIDDIPF